MLKAIENCIEKVNIPLDEALRMGSTYPAQLMKDSTRGLLKTGYKADIIVFDKDLKHHSTYISGKLN